MNKKNVQFDHHLSNTIGFPWWKNAAKRFIKLKKPVYKKNEAENRIFFDGDERREKVSTTR